MDLGGWGSREDLGRVRRGNSNENILYGKRPILIKNINAYIKKNKNKRQGREMTQCLSALATLLEDPNSIPNLNTYMVALFSITSVPGHQTFSFVLRVHYTHVVNRHIYR